MARNVLQHIPVCVEMSAKAWYTLATKSNSTQLTLSKAEVDCVALAPYTLAAKLLRFGQQKLPTFDRVEHAQLWRRCPPRHDRQS